METNIFNLLIALMVILCFSAAYILVELSEMKKLLKKVSSDIKLVNQNTKNKTKKAKPTNIHETEHKQSYWGKCPTCGELVSSNLKYCLKCGQALDWGEKE